MWQGGEASDFELKMQMKGTGAINGGVQYRGWIAPRPQRGAPPAGVPGAAAAPAVPPQPPAGAANAAGGLPPGAAPAAQGGGGGRGPGAVPERSTARHGAGSQVEDQWNMWGAQ